MIAQLVFLAATFLPGQAAKAPTALDLKNLRVRREWLYNKPWEREESGYFDWAESSPDGVFYPAGGSDTLYYCSFFGGEDDPTDDRFYVTCWERKGNKAVRRWQVKLLPGKEPVRGTLLRHAGGQTMDYTTSRNGKTFQAHIKGFYPDRTAPEWKLAQPDMERRQTLVHYHFNWHGDPSLGHYVDLHGDNDAQTGMQPLDIGGPPMVIPKAELVWLRRSGMPGSRVSLG